MAFREQRVKVEGGRRGAAVPNLKAGSTGMKCICGGRWKGGRGGGGRKTYREDTIVRGLFLGGEKSLVFVDSVK